MAATRPYLLIYKGKKHIIEAANAALAVHHVVGADISELRPARAAEVTQWMRDKNEIPVADGKRTEAAVEAAVLPADNSDLVLKPNDGPSERALILFEDWAGYDRAADVNTIGADNCVAMFARMHPGGQLTLEQFDALRVQAPEFADALIAHVGAIARTNDESYVNAIKAYEKAGLGILRSRLEQRPMPFNEVVEAILHHAGIDAE